MKNSVYNLFRVFYLFTSFLLFILKVNAQQPKLILPIGHVSGINITSFSPDGKKIITGSTDGTVKVWDAASGKMLLDLTGHSKGITKATFSPGGEKILTASDDCTVKIWDANNGNLLVNFKGHEKEVKGARFSPDGKKIITVSADNNAIIWDASNGFLLANLIGHTDIVTTGIFSPDGEKVLTSSKDKTARLWDANTGRILFEMKHWGWVRTALFSPDGNKIITTSSNHKAYIWDVASGNLLNTLKGHTDLVNTAVFSPDGKKIVTASIDETAKIWSSEGNMLADLKGHAQGVTFANFSPDNKKILTIPQDKMVKIWDAENGLLLLEIKADSIWAHTATFSPDSKKIITGSFFDGSAKIWNAINGALLYDLKGHSSYVYISRYTPDGKRIITISIDHTIRIWNTETLALLSTLTGHTNYISAIDFSLDGNEIVTGSYDNTVKVWSIKEGNLLMNLTGHTDQVKSVCFSPDGKNILSGSKDGSAKVWDEKGNIVREIKFHKTMVKQAVYWPADSTVKIISAPDVIKRLDIGRVLVPGGGQVTATTWSVATGKKIADVQLFPGEITHFNDSMLIVNRGGFSPDGKKLLMKGDNNDTKICNAKNGDLLFSFFPVDSTDYLIVDKDNHYDGTEAARKLLYYTCNSEIIELQQLKDKLWVQGLAERINKGETINAPKLSDLDICGLTPIVELTETDSNYLFNIKSQRAELGETVLSINGIQTETYDPSELQKNSNGYALSVMKKDLAQYFITGKENLVSVKAYIKGNEISSRGVDVLKKASSQTSVAPNLYAVVIGISDYKGEQLDLRFAAKDATDISRSLSLSAGKFLGKDHVFVYNLNTSKERDVFPEKKNIKDMLNEIGKKVTANDILLIFFAGHGYVNGDNKQFYFLTADASASSFNTEALKDAGISTSELTEWIRPQFNKAQKRILIFDACNSGQAINDFVKFGTTTQGYTASRNDDKAQQIKALDKLNEKSGLFILSASESNQNAYEVGRYSQGLLTYALLKTIKQDASILEDNKFLNIGRWFNAAEKIVSDISEENGERQNPQIITNTNFNIGIVDDEIISKIVLADDKPLFSASSFQNNEGYDDLELTRQMNRQLNDKAHDDAGNIIYTATTDSRDAYELSGRYEVKNDKITVKVNLKQRKEKLPKFRFELEGKTNNIATILEQIFKQALNWINENKSRF